MAASSSSSSSTDAQWRKLIDEETCPIKKQMLTAAFSRLQQVAATTPSKYDPALTRGGKPNRIAEVYLYCTGSEEKKYTTFTKTIARVTRFGLTFNEVLPLDGKIDVANDLSAIFFTLPIESVWVGGKRSCVSATGFTDVQIMKSITIAPGWYRFPNFTVEQKTGKDGTVYTNAASDPPQEWLNGPSALCLHTLACRLYANSRSMLRPVDPQFFPPQSLISAMELEVNGSADKTTEGEGDDDKKRNEYKLHALAYSEAFDRHVRSLGVDWQQHPDLCQQHPKSRHPFIFPLTIGRHAASRIAKDDKAIVTHMPVFFDDDIRVKAGTEVKVFEVTTKNVFSTHLTASANTTVIRTDLESGGMQVLTVAVAMRSQNFFHHLGIVNPNIAQGVLPRILSNVPMTVIATLNMQQTQSKNALSGSADQSSQCLVFDVFNPPLVDYLTMIRDNSVQVTADFAVRAVNKYIKSRSPNTPTSDTKAKASVLDTGKASTQHYIIEQNPVGALSGGLIANCMETKFTVDGKKGSQSWRFYAMTGYMPRDDALRAYYETVEAFHSAEAGSAAAQELDAQLAKFAAEFSADLSGSIDDAKYFTHNDDMTKHDIQPTTVVWAISRKLDHVQVIDYDNEQFSTDAVVKRSEYIRQFNAAKEQPVKPATPVPVEDTPSLEMTEDLCVAQPQPTPAIVIAAEDDEDEGLAAAVPSVIRKRREPTSPGKKNAVAKRNRQ